MAKSKEYKIDLEITPDTVNENDVVSLIRAVKKGINYSYFSKIADDSPFTLIEWSVFLHISDRTMLRYKKENKAFDPLQSEKIIQIGILFKKGKELFGNKENFNSWLSTENVALGNIKPKELLDNTFGINLLLEELNRIEHGIFA